jgi:uncharacterized membrane protein
MDNIPEKRFPICSIFSFIFAALLLMMQDSRLSLAGLCATMEKGSPLPRARRLWPVPVSPANQFVARRNGAIMNATAKTSWNTQTLVQISLIGALYTVLTLISGPLAFGSPAGVIQLRISEAFTLLPLFSPIGIWGVTFGCFLSNLVGFFMGTNLLGLIDAPLGTAATLIAAWLTYLIGQMPVKQTAKFLFAPVPPVLVNGLIVGFELTFVFQTPFSLNFLSVIVGEAAVCYTLGILLCVVLRRNDFYKKIFR